MMFFALLVCKKSVLRILFIKCEKNSQDQLYKAVVEEPTLVPIFYIVNGTFVQV